MNKFFNFITFSVDTPPKAFGLYHIICLVIVILLSASCIIFRKKISNKFVNNSLIVVGATYIILEVYKQIVFCWNYGQFTSYPWFVFPFTFCSSPIYVTMLAGILKKGKIYEYLTSYLATYALFAGLIVMLIPGDVFCWWAGINVQTMFLHGMMTVIAFLLLATKTVSPKWSSLLKASIVFAAFLVVAMAMNLAWPLLKIDVPFNMFQLSPYYTTSYPVLNTIQANYPYIVFFLAFLFGFVLAVTIIFSIYKLILKLSKRKTA